jgi:penicillin-binding protein 2
MQLRLLKSITFFCFIFLILALFYNQIIKAGYYYQLSRDNSIKLVSLAAPRGIIYDRKMRILAGRRVCFNVSVLTQQARDVEKILKQISPILGISEGELRRRFKRNFSAPFVPTLVAQDIPKEKAISLESQESNIPGLLIQTEPLRDYPYGAKLCHLLGYLGSAREEELARLKSYGLGFQDLLGRGGLEERFDANLRGQSGGIQVEVNNRGHQVRVISQRQPTAGEDIYLTVDGQLQRFVDNLMEGENGACIVIDPRDGAVLSMVSKPGYDPNLFIAALKGKPQAAQRVRAILNSKQAPLLNRAVSSAYAPGSIFKIVVASAALESEKISTKDYIHCPGSFQVGNRPFLCWKLDGHAGQNVYSGLANSCNVFFYNLGLKLGPDRLTLYAKQFGMAALSGVDLPYESSGNVPSRSWKLKYYRERWYDGETANFSIGQGYLLATPLQVAQMVSAVANGGYMVRPYLVKRVGVKSVLPFRKELGLEDETLDAIREGLHQAINNQDGTGRKAYIPDVQWAGKTGTAQTEKADPHGWFAGFYPLNNPQVLVLVFLEYGGSGGELPAIIAREIIEYIRENKL